MIWLKGCPRCHDGDIYQGTDIHGPYISCLQCGHYLTETEEARFALFAPRQVVQPVHFMQKEEVAV